MSRCPSVQTNCSKFKILLLFAARIDGQGQFWVFYFGFWRVCIRFPHIAFEVFGRRFWLVAGISVGVVFGRIGHRQLAHAGVFVAHFDRPGVCFRVASGVHVAVLVVVNGWRHRLFAVVLPEVLIGRFWDGLFLVRVGGVGLFFVEILVGLLVGHRAGAVVVAVFLLVHFCGIYP